MHARTDFAVWDRIKYLQRAAGKSAIPVRGVGGTML